MAIMAGASNLWKVAGVHWDAPFGKECAEIRIFLGPPHERPAALLVGNCIQSGCQQLAEFFITNFSKLLWTQHIAHDQFAIAEGLGKLRAIPGFELPKMLEINAYWVNRHVCLARKPQ